MKSVIAMLLCFPSAASAIAETNWNLQKVDSRGVGTHWSITSHEKVTVEGTIINRPEYMLDGTPDYNTIPGDIGGAWQLYIQGNSDANDHAGTAVWVGQNYANLTFAGGIGRYTNEEWLAELRRLSFDQRTGHRFMPGDRVRVTGLTRFFGGKTNITERHNTTPKNDITIELIQTGAGMPEAALITLADLKDESDKFIFDPNRLTGNEYHQARLVRINDVSFVDSSGWAPGATLTITDGTRTFPLTLGIGPGITVSSNNLPQQFDVIGILDQEGPLYRLWVVNYDGNGEVLVDGCDLYGNFVPADINKDCNVNFLDFAILAESWLQCTNQLLPGCTH